MTRLPQELAGSVGTILLVGTGKGVIAKLNELRACGRDVRWFPTVADVAEEIILLNVWRRGRFHVLIDDPLAADLSDIAAVVSGAGAAVDEPLARRARATGIPVHVVGRPDLSTFGFPDDRGGSRPVGSWVGVQFQKWFGLRGRRTECPEVP